MGGYELAAVILAFFIGVALVVWVVGGGTDQ
jgi:hypothetical protein